MVVCGTGLIECVLSGLLSQEGIAHLYPGKKVLHIDRNGFYEGKVASVNLTNMWKIFRDKEESNKDPGYNRDWNIDLIPNISCTTANSSRSSSKLESSNTSKEV